MLIFTAISYQVSNKDYC